jgi:hypothetical protein
MGAILLCCSAHAEFSAWSKASHIACNVLSMRWPCSQFWATLRLLLHILIAVCTAQVEAMLNEGIFDMQKYVDGGWVTGLKYEDEVMDDLKKRTGGKADKLRSVSMCVILHVILYVQNM